MTSIGHFFVKLSIVLFHVRNITYIVTERILVGRVCFRLLWFVCKKKLFFCFLMFRGVSNFVLFVLLNLYPFLYFKIPSPVNRIVYKNNRLVYFPYL